ncbi:MAG: tRNA (adenosine(37)-N6)-threonylcarbamoyltransferase complex transferase subunit TsaD [Candidatus Nomurabacteria bacterium]|jgi:N6-L-threonylcarbamoyladenine synthase|nr:tRNA (adenosine(37)-N6)-threonylcarbamoyltransferase complex transferase subunit TsaD [Candidatus Nomurabacteria bacterium]
MKILGIETSCDETAAAVVEDGRRVLSNVVVSQIDIHAAFGGVVPEVAARSHIEVILPVVEEAVSDWSEIDAIAVANRPGLIGSLLIGTLTAKTLAKLKSKPLFPVDHVVSHVYANFLTTDFDIEFPLLALVVSGGHTQLMLFRSHTDYEIVGQTRDDAVGEAFDKVAKMLGLPYPGGPSIAAASRKGQPKHPLPHPKLDTPLDFSFSGLKTAVLRAVQAEVGKNHTFPSSQLSGLLTASQQADFAASFQQTAVAILVNKLQLAAEKYQPRTICLGGGVSANQLLQAEAKRVFPNILLPQLGFSTDNAAMIASRGFFESLSQASTNPNTVDVYPT